MRVFIYGAGKVGRALAAAAKANGMRVTLVPARDGLPKRLVRADLLIVTVRDGDIAKVAAAAAAARIVGPRTAVVHVAGAVDAEPLAALRGVALGVAQMHPMISFASKTAFPPLANGNVHVKGDAAAERVARAFARKIGMTPRTFPRLDPIGYHAAAAFVANGAAALAAVGVEILEASGVAKDEAPKLLGPLLLSVAANVSSLGFPAALTGPVRRGDPKAIEKHLGILRAKTANAVPLYLASVAAQLPLGRALAEAPAEAFDAIATWLAKQG